MMDQADFRRAVLEKFEEKEELCRAYVDSNIEAHRKGNVTLRLTDKTGAPIAGKRIHVSQKSHDFKYGANLFLLDEFPDGERNARYREVFSEYFNLATVPFYWAELEPVEGKPRFAADSPKIYRRPAPDLCLDYCREKGISAKLHCLFYDKFIPDWLPKRDEAEMFRLYEKRFREIAERYGNGKLYEVEVSNELLDEYRWTTQSVLCNRRDTPLWAWKMAERYFLNDTLVINEAQQLPSLAVHDYRAPYFLFLESLMNGGARIDKIGVQHHMFVGSHGPQETELPKYLKLMDPENVIHGLQILSDFGKPLEITEVTVPTFLGDEETQAELLRRLYEIWFATPLMESVVYWNTADGTAYVSPSGTANENNVHGGLFRNDLSPKQSAQMLKHLFGEVWHTELDLETDADGRISFRGFYGDYEARVGKTAARFGLRKGNGSVAVQI